MPDDRRRPERDVTPVFRDTVAQWISASGEVLVILRYLRAAGRKNVVLCRSSESFDQMVGLVPPGTDIVVFRRKQLPLRGRADDGFIASARALVPDGAEYLAVALGVENSSPLSADWDMGESHQGLREFLEQWRGQEVAVGPGPDFNTSDHEDLVSASKGGVDGPR